MTQRLDITDLRPDRHGTQPAWLSACRKRPPASTSGDARQFTDLGCHDCGGRQFRKLAAEPDSVGNRWHCMTCGEILTEVEFVEDLVRELRAYLHALGHSNTADDLMRDALNQRNGWTAAKLRRATLDFCDQHPDAEGSTAARKARSLFGSVDEALTVASFPGR